MYTNEKTNCRGDVISKGDFLEGPRPKREDFIEYFNRPPQNRLISKHDRGEEKKKEMDRYRNESNTSDNSSVEIIQREGRKREKKKIGEETKKKNLIRAINKVYILKREILVEYPLRLDLSGFDTKSNMHLSGRRR